MIKGREFFTADTHFGHNNIIKYCNRPFSSIEEMDTTLINSINRCVSKNDTLYHLGDFCMCKHGKSPQWYKDKINCKNIIIIIGNHDPRNKDGTPQKDFANIFSRCYQNLRHKTQKSNGEFVLLWMSHYAHVVWDKSHYGSINLFGHSHTALEDNPMLMSMDVGVDSAAKLLGEYRPFTIDEIMEFMAKKKWSKI